MKIVILAAMDKELQLLTSLFQHSEDVSIDGVSLRYGKVGKHDIYVGKCGIGKVNSAINTYRIATSIIPDLIINSGVAGGAGIPIGSTLIADRVAYSDVWCGPGTTFGEADSCPLFFKPSSRIVEMARNIVDDDNVSFGLICSSDRFISEASQIHTIRSFFPDVQAVDMESASIAQTCFMTDIPFAIVRVVSDTPGEGENLSQYQNFWTEAPQKTFSVVKKIIENL